MMKEFILAESIVLKQAKARIRVWTAYRINAKPANRHAAVVEFAWDEDPFFCHAEEPRGFASEAAAKVAAYNALLIEFRSDGMATMNLALLGTGGKVSRRAHARWFAAAQKYLRSESQRWLLRVPEPPPVPAVPAAADKPAALDRDEKRELAKLESTIRKNVAAYFEVGAALQQIRDRRLYRERYETFEAYCRAEWDFQRAHAYRLIDAAQVVTAIGRTKLPAPANELQARALAKVDDKQIPQVWKKIVHAAPKDAAGRPQVTAKLAAEIVHEWVTPPDELAAEKERPRPAAAATAGTVGEILPAKSVSKAGAYELTAPKLIDSLQDQEITAEERTRIIRTMERVVGVVAALLEVAPGSHVRKMVAEELRLLGGRLRED